MVSGGKQCGGSSHQLKFKLPTHFDQCIDGKLKGETEKFLLNEYSALARDLSRQIITITNSPDTDFIKFVVEKCMEKYPIAIFDKENPNNTKVCLKSTKYGVYFFFFTFQKLMVNKIRDICARLRRKSGTQLSIKGGRPPKEKASTQNILGPRRRMNAQQDSNGYRSENV